VIGSFHVVRSLGHGGVSSVFLARRFEERNSPKAESFALKVPEYDPSTARSLSEQEFFELFREEAGALLSLPAHENLARFVTFDLSARPKPILVMELIRGSALDRLVRTRAMSMTKVVTFVHGILSGLDAMHSVGIGHLDLKPSNVILRDGRTPVLVDFGLSGRKLRPGCGTLEYTSPEVLGVLEQGHEPSPLPADVYSLACLTYELVTGDLLFTAGDELALVAQHVSHAGWPDKLRAMAGTPKLLPLAQVLSACLSPDPRARPTVRTLDDTLMAALLPLADQPWPAVPV
jgi:serine/threonine protein kinase